MHSLTIVIPVYNEAENIRVAIEKIESEITVPHTISIVYDMDTDTTVPVVQEMAKSLNNITLLKNKYGRGVLNAIKTGLEDATTDYAVVTMADLSDPPSVINDMVNLAEAKNADIVCASRYMKGGKQIGGPFIKGLMSKIAGLTLHWFAGVPTHDSTNSFKLYRTSFLQKQKIESSGGFELGLELVVKAYGQDYTIAETPTTWTDRVAGKSNFKLLAWLGNYLKWYFYAFSVPIKKYRISFIKYFVAGFICALIDWSIFYVLNYWAHIYYLFSAACAFIISGTINYFLCKQIFISRGRKQIVDYFLVLFASTIALSIDLSVMYLLVEQLVIPPMLAKILGTGTAFIFNYLSRQFFIFSSEKR
ncbi:dolichol-phosphate mannosyltransferase [Fibrobacterales bacterium]|nr:dolichol-phosphate mannosyltransferase [Fibrobacterales bacterium]